MREITNIENYRGKPMMVTCLYEKNGRILFLKNENGKYDLLRAPYQSGDNVIAGTAIRILREVLGIHIPDTRMFQLIGIFYNEDSQTIHFIFQIQITKLSEIKHGVHYEFMEPTDKLFQVLNSDDDYVILKKAYGVSG